MTLTEADRLFNVRCDREIRDCIAWAGLLWGFGGAQEIGVGMWLDGIPEMISWKMFEAGVINEYPMP